MVFSSQSPFFSILATFVPEGFETVSVVGAGLFVWLMVRSLFKKTVTEGRRPVTLPTTLPLLGNMIDFMRHDHARHDWFVQLGERYQGRPFQVLIPGRPPIAVVYTPDLVEDTLKTHFEDMPKSPVQQDNFRDLLGHGIFAVDGTKWVHQRKTASHPFTARAMRDTVTESMRRFTSVLVRILDQASDSHEVIDVFKLMNKFTIEAFAKMRFGIDMNCREATEEHPFQSAFDNSQHVLRERFQRPGWFWKLQRWLGIGLEGQLKRDIEIIDETVVGIVSESLARRGMKKSETASADIVSLFLDRFEGSDGEQFDPTYLRDIVVNFIIAGRDTTAQAMSWCFYNLSTKPEVVAKIRAEIALRLPQLADGTRTDPPTMEEVQQLTYLDATLKETLRLHPSVPTIPKEATRDVVFSDGTLIENGTLVFISTYTMARMESVWGRDAKQFNPDRWIDPVTGRVRNVSAFKFASFNAGPRICLGINLAMLEMKIVMASVLSRFNLDILPNQEIIYDNSLTLPIKGAMLARVTKAF